MVLFYGCIINDMGVLIYVKKSCTFFCIANVISIGLYFYLAALLLSPSVVSLTFTAEYVSAQCYMHIVPAIFNTNPLQYNQVQHRVLNRE